jgi:hypothetical protein
MPFKECLRLADDQSFTPIEELESKTIKARVAAVERRGLTLRS